PSRRRMQMCYAIAPRFANRSQAKGERKRWSNRSLIETLVALLLMSGAAAASAQEVTQAENDRALQYLESTKKKVLEATKGMSEEQWNNKSVTDSRSVGQANEHISASAGILLL